MTWESKLQLESLLSERRSPLPIVVVVNPLPGLEVNSNYFYYVLPVEIIFRSTNIGCLCTFVTFPNGLRAPDGL